METKIYPYKPRLALFSLCAIGFAAAAVILISIAVKNDRRLIINGIFTLSVDQATVFFWVLTAFSISFSIIALLLIAKGFLSHREIHITENEITSPKSGFSNTILTVPFKDIIKLDVFEYNSQKILTIHYNGGKLSIPHSMLPDKHKFSELCDLVAEKVNCK